MDIRAEWGEKTKIKVAYTQENNKIREYDKLTCVCEVQKEKKISSLIFQLGDLTSLLPLHPNCVI